MPETLPAKAPAIVGDWGDIVDLSFPLQGLRVPQDHGFALYGALCQLLPTLHKQPWLGVHPLRGQRLVSGYLALPSRAQLRLRIPAVMLSSVLPLVGQTLGVNGEKLRLGTPTVSPLVPSMSLDARIVLIRLTAPLHQKSDGSLGAAAIQSRCHAEMQRQLAALGVTAEITITGKLSIGVHGRRLLGHSVRLVGLTEEGSLLVQRRGLGGKRAMGCGIFVPTLVRKP